MQFEKETLPTWICHTHKIWVVTIFVPLSRNGAYLILNNEHFFWSDNHRSEHFLESKTFTFLSLGLRNAARLSGTWASQVEVVVKNQLSTQDMQETWVWSLGWEDPLEEGMATHSNVLAWRIPGTGEPGGLPSGVAQSQTQLKWLSSSMGNGSLSTTQPIQTNVEKTVHLCTGTFL